MSEGPSTSLKTDRPLFHSGEKAIAPLPLRRGGRWLETERPLALLERERERERVCEPFPHTERMLFPFREEERGSLHLSMRREISLLLVRERECPFP